MSEQSNPEIDRLKLQVKMWQNSVSTTKHFTEMSVKMRQLGLTFVVAAFAVAITLLSQYPTARLTVPLGSVDYDIHLSGLIVMTSVVGLFVTKLLDVELYHRMLRGSVAFTMELESKVLRPLMGTDRGLAESISHHSRSTRPAINGDEDTIRKKTSAERKIKLFYNLSMVFVALIGAALTIITANKVEKRVIINQRIEFVDPPKVPPPPKK